MLKVIVKRSKWYRGKGSTQSRLLLSNGRMCCIGFLCRACGLAPQEIKREPTVEHLEHSSQQKVKERLNEVLPKELTTGDAYDIIDVAYNVNDDAKLREDMREERLKQLGKNMGVEFEFVD